MSEQITEQDINQENHLLIGGADATQLAQQFGTPLVAYDVSKIRSQIKAFKRVFEEKQVPYAVSYASKAFSAIGMYEVVAQEGGHTDVVSGGELYTALQANFPVEDISFNGNNKSYDELVMAIDAGIGAIIVDNFHEIDLIEQILSTRSTSVNVLLRITPGISAHTHEFISTGQEDSKFGFDLKSGQARVAFERVMKNSKINMRGVHAHIGSQIFDVHGFVAAAEKLVDIVADWRESFGYEVEVINVGGGFGIRYTKDDTPIPAESFVAAIIDAVKAKTEVLNMKMPEIWIEPGRSVVGPAGYSLYTIGSRKDIPGINAYLAVDGGMGDNIRPALYQAEYEALLASNVNAKSEEVVRIAGKYCESGDILVWQQALPQTKPGDVIAILATGAYGYAMASNYNRNPKPAVVFVEDGQAKLVIARESYDDLVHLDRHYV